MNFAFLRISLLVATLALATFSEPHASAQSASPGPFTREAMLRDIAAKTIAPACEELAMKCRELTNAVELLAADPNQSLLDKARQAFTAAADAASRIRCFQAGPMADRGYAATFFFSRVSPPNIEALLRSARAIDGTVLDEVGAGVKSMFTLEYLLFGHKGSPGMDKPNGPLVLSMLSAKDSQRRRAYLVAVAREVETRAGQLARDWTSPGAQGAAAKFVAGGQESVNLLVNQLAHAIEDAADNHLKYVLLLPNPISGQLYRIEHSPSGSSLQGVVTYLEGARKLFLGAGGLGLADALKQVNPPLEKRIETQFDAVLAATQAINAPLEQAVVDNRPSIQNACDKLRALQIQFKVDLASALGVTLTFSANDGD